MVTASSSILRPNDDTGGAFSHAPDSLVAAPRSLAFVKGSWAFSRRLSKVALILGLSHAFCHESSGVAGGDALRSMFHMLSAASTSGCVKDCKCGGRIFVKRALQPAAEARKAEGAG